MPDVHSPRLGTWTGGVAVIAGCLATTFVPACGSSQTASEVTQPPRAVVIASASAVAPPQPAVLAQEVLGPPVLVPQLFRSDIQLEQLSPDGRLLMVPAEEGVQMVDTATGQARGVHVGCVASGTFAANSRSYLFTTCQKGDLYQWDLTTDSTRSLGPLGKSVGLGVPSGGHYAVAVRKEGADLIDTDSGERTSFPIPHRRTLRFASVAQNGTVVATDDDEVLIFAKGAVLPLTVPFPKVAALALSLSGKQLVFSGKSGPARSVDVTSGKTLAEAQLCDAHTADLEFTDGGDRLIAACEGGKKKSVAVASFKPSLELDKPLLSDGTKPAIWVGRTRVATLDPQLGVTVFDVATGKPLQHVSGTGRRLTVDDALDKFVVYTHRIQDTVFYDEARGALPWRLTQNVEHLQIIRAARGALEVERDRSPYVFDTAMRSFVSRGELSEDGDVVLVPAEGLVVPQWVHRSTGKGSPLDYQGIDATPHDLSPREDHVLIYERGDSDHSEPDLIQIFDANGKKRALKNIGYPPSTAMSATTDLLAYVMDTGAARGHPCANESGPPCWGLQIANMTTGSIVRRLKLAHDLSSPSPEMRFSASGKQLLVERAFYDVQSGALLWKLPEEANLLGFNSTGNIAFLKTPKEVSVVDTSSGKEVGRLRTIDRLLGSSDNAAITVACVDGKVELIDSSKLTVNLLDLTVSENVEKAWVTNDGKFVWTVDSPAVVAYRVHDGRSLRWVGASAPVSDDGVFDPADASRLPYAIRKGPSVLTSPMTTLESAQVERRHPRLVWDFFADRSID